MNQPVALTIAGSDPSGGAGLQADLKTFHQHRVYGMSVVTLLTVQNTKSVTAVRIIEPEFVLQQLDAVLSDILPSAAKTGALGSAAIIEVIADRASRFKFPLVVDPVMISKHGIPLLDSQAVDVLIKKLLPWTMLVTPNLAEAAALAGFEVNSIESMTAAAKAIAQLGPQNVLIKGGHLPGAAIDVLWAAGELQLLRAPRVETTNTHGTGCVTSAAITAVLAQGETLHTAVHRAKKFVSAAIQTNPGLGLGYGPINLFIEP